MPLRSLRAPRRASTFAACALRPAAVLLWVLLAVAPGAQPVASSDAARAEAAFRAARALYDGGLFGPAARDLQAFRAAYPLDAHAPEALYLLAEASLATGDPQRAAVLFQQFEQAYPVHPLASRARLALGRYYVATGDLDLAEQALLDALSRPAPPEAHAEAAYLLGQTALRQERTDAAIQAFERAATDDTPTGAPALYALGVTHAAAGNPAGAASAFERLALRYPEAPETAEVRLGLAEAYLRANRLRDATAEIERRRPALIGDDAERADLLLGETRLLLGDADGALAPLAAVPEGSPYARRAQLATGRAAFAQRRWGPAIAAFTAARSATAADTRDDLISHEALYYEGLALKADGTLGEAERRLAAATLRLPSGPYADAALLELGILHYERRRYADAATAFDRLARAQPRSAYAGEAARFLGESYAAQGDAARAREAFRLAEQLGTATAETRAEVAFQDAFALLSAGDFDGATDALLAVYSSDPRGPRAGEALFWAGESAFRADRYARAETILADFVSRFPEHGRADEGRYVLAWTHFKRRDYAAAAAAYERFLSAYERGPESVPYYADALLRLGDSYYALRRFEDARQVYALVPTATADAQGADYALFQTAQSYAGQGLVDEAIATYGQIISRYEASDLFAEALVARGALLVGAERSDEAATDFSRAATERPNSPSAARALVGLGDVRFNQERHADAEAAYRRVLDRYPSSAYVPDALEGLGYALDALGRSAEFDSIVAAVEQRASDPETRARIRLGRAQSALASGETEAGVALLDGLVAGGAPAEIEADALLTLSGAYLTLERPADAARTLRRLLSRHPTSPLAPEAQLQLAEALLAADDAAGALAEAVRFPQAYPDDAERVAAALRIEARALRALGRDAEADERLRLLLSRFPGSAAATAVQRERPDLAPAPAPAPGSGR